MLELLINVIFGRPRLRNQHVLDAVSLDARVDGVRDDPHVDVEHLGVLFGKVRVVSSVKSMSDSVDDRAERVGLAGIEEHQSLGECLGELAQVGHRVVSLVDGPCGIGRPTPLRAVVVEIEQHAGDLVVDAGAELINVVAVLGNVAGEDLKHEELHVLESIVHVCGTRVAGDVEARLAELFELHAIDRTEINDIGLSFNSST